MPKEGINMPVIEYNISDTLLLPASSNLPPKAEFTDSWILFSNSSADNVMASESTTIESFDDAANAAPANSTKSAANKNFFISVIFLFSVH